MSLPPFSCPLPTSFIVSVFMDRAHTTKYRGFRKIVKNKVNESILVIPDLSRLPDEKTENPLPLNLSLP